jgi:hypothetical protein
MAKFDGLIWKKGDDNWAYLPTGIGAVTDPGFSLTSDDAVLRVEDGLVAGHGGKKIDFQKENELLSACPAQAGDLKVLWAGVHPTNLKAAIIVWSAPITLLDPSKITGGSKPSLNGRIMTLTLDSPVKIDGSSSQTIQLQAGAVGKYGSKKDPDVARVTDTSKELYAGTKNDTSVGNDQTSQTKGSDIVVFAVNGAESVTVNVSMKYKVVDAKQTCGKPHKIWGAAYCIWGSTIPLETFPYGTTLEVDAASLAPKSGYYGGTVDSDSYVDRKAAFKIAVTGVAGPIIKLDSVNDRAVPLQPGQAVAFSGYGCDTVCGTKDQTKISDIDEALAYVDEDVIKPSERTFPVYTFIETTYYMTTMNAITTLEVPAFTQTTLYETLLSNIWQGTQVYGTAVKWDDQLTQLWQGTEVYGTAVQWDPSFQIPKGVNTTITLPVGGDQTGTIPLHLVDATKALKIFEPGDVFAGYVYFADDATIVKYLVAEGAAFTNKPFVVDPVNVVCHSMPANAKIPVGNPTYSSAKTFSQGTLQARLIPDPGAVVSGEVAKTNVSLSTATVQQIPAGGKVITSIGTTSLVVCSGGSPTTIQIVTSIGTAAADPLTINYLSAPAAFQAVTDVPTAAADVVPITTLFDIASVDVVTTIPVADPTPVTAITGSTELISIKGRFDDILKTLGNPTTAYYIKDSLTAPIFTGTTTADVFLVTAYAAPPYVELTKYAHLTDPQHIDLTKYTALRDMTVFTNVGEEHVFLKPQDGDAKLTLAIIDETAKIPILGTQGSNPVKLLISDTGGTMSLIGMTTPLQEILTDRSTKGQCVPGAVDVSTIPGADYEEPGMVKLLAPIPVQKSRGDAEECPCFTVNDTDGGPSAPSDNSALASINPCTIRVRRLQLKDCHT